MNAIDDLVKAGIQYDDAVALRRISMTLHRWHELECGDSNDSCSTVLVRGNKQNGSFVYDDDGKPFIETHWHRWESSPKPSYYRIPDRERGAQKRLAKILRKYPGYLAYVQGDPRGCALYILRPGDLREGSDISSCYTNGLAVYR